MGLKLSAYRPRGVRKIDLGDGAYLEVTRAKVAERAELANFVQWMAGAVGEGVQAGDLDGACAQIAAQFAERFGHLFVGCSGLLADDGSELALSEALPLIGKDPDLLSDVALGVLRTATVSEGEGND